MSGHVRRSVCDQVEREGEREREAAGEREGEGEEGEDGGEIKRRLGNIIVTKEKKKSEKKS